MKPLPFVSIDAWIDTNALVTPWLTSWWNWICEGVLVVALGTAFLWCLDGTHPSAAVAAVATGAVVTDLVEAALHAGARIARARLDSSGGRVLDPALDRNDGRARCYYHGADLPAGEASLLHVAGGGSCLRLVAPSTRASTQKPLLARCHCRPSGPCSWKSENWGAILACAEFRLSCSPPASTLLWFSECFNLDSCSRVLGPQQIEAPNGNTHSHTSCST